MRASVLLTLALSALAAPLAAQTIESPIRYIEDTQAVGFYAGHVWTQQPKPALGPRSAPIVGAQYDVRLSGPLHLEAGLGLILSEREVFARPDTLDPFSPVPSIGVVSAPIGLAEAGLRFQLTGARTWHDLAPYVVGSLGVVANLKNREEIERDARDTERFRFGPGLAVGAGMGTEWFLTRRLTLNAEVRDRLWRFDIAEGFSENLSRPKERSDWTHNVGVTLGGRLHF